MSRAALGAAIVMLLVLAGSAAASAHSYFVQSDPADGSILERAPQKVVLVFSSAVAPDFTSVQLVEGGGHIYSPSSVRGYPGHPNIVEIGLPQIPAGSYRLSFATRDSVDLHATAGTIVFGVGMAPASPGVVPSASPPVPSEVVLRWLALAGLAAILGGLAVTLLVAGRLPEPPAARMRVQRSLLGLALVGIGLVLVDQTALLALQASSLGPVAPSMVRLLEGSEYGLRWLVTVLLVAGLGALLAILWIRARREEVPSFLRQLRRLRGWAVLTIEFRAVLLAFALTVAMAFSGHVAGAGGTSVVGVALMALHVGAMGLWAGGLVALALSLFVMRRAAGQLRRSSVMALVVGFGPIAAVSFATLGATGLLLSGIQVASITALLSTQYGAVLVAKAALVGLVALIGLRHALWTWRGLARRGPWLGRIPQRLPLTIALEACGAIGVVLLASVLSASAPARGPQFDAPSTATNVTQATREQDGLLITLSVKPDTAGPNLVGVNVISTRRPALAPVQRVMVTIVRPNEGPQLLATTPSGSHYDAGSVNLSTGDVRFTVTVERMGIAASVASVPWQVNAPEVPRAPVVMSNQPLSPIVDVAALIGILIAAGLVTAGWMRHRRARHQAPLHEHVRRARRPDREQTPRVAHGPRLWHRSSAASRQRAVTLRRASRARPRSRASK
jgi:copper transport protein